MKSGHKRRMNMLGVMAHLWESESWLRERQRDSELKQVFSSCYTVTATRWCTVKSTADSYLPCLSPKCKQTRLHRQFSIYTFWQVNSNNLCVLRDLWQVHRFIDPIHRLIPAERPAWIVFWMSGFLSSLIWLDRFHQASPANTVFTPAWYSMLRHANRGCFK